MGPQDYWSSLKQRTQNKNESLRLQFAMPATFINYLYLSHNGIASVDSEGLLERTTFHLQFRG